MRLISKIEVKQILGDDYINLSEEELERLIFFLENLCDKVIEEVINNDGKIFKH